MSSNTILISFNVYNSVFTKQQLENGGYQILMWVRITLAAFKRRL